MNNNIYFGSKHYGQSADLSSWNVRIHNYLASYKAYPRLENAVNNIAIEFCV